MLLMGYIPLLLLIVLLYRLTKTRIYVTLPIFFSYVAYAVAAGLLRFVFQTNHYIYFRVYWLTEAGYAVLGAFVLYEIFRVALGNMKNTLWFRLLAFCALVITTSVVLLHFHRHPQEGLPGKLALILAFEFEVRLLQSFLFAAFVFLMALLEIRWPQYVFSVIGGFGLYAAVCLLATMNFRFSEKNFTILWGGIQLAAYLGTVLIWLWTFRVPPKAESHSRYAGGVSAALEETEQYMNVLKKIRNRKPL